MVFSGSAKQLGRRNRFRKVQYPMIVILKHQQQAIQACSRNENRSDPVVDLSSRHFMRVYPVGRDGLDSSAPNQLIVKIGVGFGQEERLPRIHSGFRGLYVTIEIASGFGLDLPVWGFRRHHGTEDAQGQNVQSA